MISATELEQLKTLRAKLRAIDAYESTIQDAKRDKNELENFNPKDVTLTAKRDTDNEAKYMADLKQVKAKKNKPINIIVAVITVVLMVIVFVANLSDNVGGKKENLHTPEIVKEYRGTYYNSSLYKTGYQDIILNVTSCTEDGKIEGILKWSAESEILGEYSFTGSIRKKGADGYVEARVKFENWIDSPDYSGYIPEDIETIIFSENYTTAKASFYDSLYEESTYCNVYSVGNKTTNLETPEIVRSYGGTYYSTSNGITKHIGVMTISSCDAEGNVTGTFEHDSHSTFGHCDTYGAYNFEGKITEKYTDGVVYLSITAGEVIEASNSRYTPQFEELNIVICDNYTKLSCTPYWINWTIDITMDELMPILENELVEEELIDLMAWVEDKSLTEENVAKIKAALSDETISQGDLSTLKATLEKELTDEEKNEILTESQSSVKEYGVKSILSVAFYLLPVLGFVVAWLLRKKVNSLTEEEKKQRDDLRAKDEEAKAENDRRYKQLVEEKRAQARSSAKNCADKIATSQKALAELEAEVAEFDVLGPKYKKNLNAVEYIVDLFENRRADSIKEAVNMYEAYVVEHDRRVIAEFNRRQDEIVRKYQAQQELEDYWAQQRHNYKLQKEAERQTDELKRIRKELEDRR